MLAFQTDRYSSRPWCQYEVLEAKRLGAHVLIVDALISGEPRSFSYCGNVPTVRWQFNKDPKVDAYRVIDRAVLEALRFKYNRTVLESTAEPDEIVLPAAPEALTLANTGNDINATSTFLYPDPPLGREELQVLNRLRPNARFLTPLTKLARWSPPSHIGTITVSISECDNVKQYGLSQEHFATLTDEIHLYLLLAGFKIAYDGALKGTLSATSNFTLRLFDLVRAYSKLAEDVNAPPLRKVILNVAPWPLYLDYGEAEWKLFAGEVADYEEMQRPTIPWDNDVLFPLGTEGRILSSDTPQRRYAWARGLTEMRERISKLSQARLVIGGKLKGFSGLVPGVMEEAWLSLSQKTPLYVAGGFGGASRAISEQLLGMKRAEFNENWAEQNIPVYIAVQELYQQYGGKYRSMERLGLDIETYGSNGLEMALNNGLTNTENYELLFCTDPQRIVELLLTGVARLPEGSI